MALERPRITWAVALRVLGAVVALLEQSYMVTVSDIAERTGLGLAEVARSLDAMDPDYVDFRKTETGGDPTFWYVLKATPRARRAVGQWPTAEGLIDRLAKAFHEAADREERTRAAKPAPPGHRAADGRRSRRRR